MVNSGLWKHRALLGRMVQRDIHSRYQGSIFGVVWAIATPLLLLGAYWFVLGEVLGARWEGISPRELPIVLFTGLMIHLYFSEIVGRAPGLVIENSTYVKKVVFPLEVLSAMTAATALFHLAISVAVLFVGQLIITGSVSAAWVFLPITLIVVTPMALGLSWFVSSISVYLRDVQQVVPLVLTLLMFISPIFYPLSLVPQEYRLGMYLNPLTVPIEQARRITVEGLAPDLGIMALYSIFSLAVMIAGKWWFSRTKQGFADVL